MQFFNVKMEVVLPVFFGCLTALIFCVLVSAKVIASAFPQTESPDGQTANAGETSTEEIFRFFTARAESERDPISGYYHDAESRPWVTDFFTGICGSREVAQAILSGAEAFTIPPALAFALCWEESQFTPLAVNHKNRDGSIDRGLFQLNNKSFPLLEQADFFNINTNAWQGMGHLRYCLDTGGSEIAALAMYNAGTGKVRNQGTPKATLDYVHRILQNRNKIEERFHSRLVQEMFADDVAAETSSESARFALLSPLLGK